jgi:tRNA nucleotidyltransferase (CCA-adding enzyme)
LKRDNPIPAIRSLQAYGLERVIHKELTIIPNTYQLLESVNKTLSWHDLLYIDEPYPRWAVYFMAILNRCSYTVCEEILNRLNVPLKERMILLEKRLKAEKQLYVIEGAPTYTRQDLYWALINFKTEYLLYMMALAKEDSTRKAISLFYTRQRSIKPYVKGKDLIKIGIPPGPVFSMILNEILNAKLDGFLKTKKQEIKFAREYAIKNKLIG